MIRAYRPRPLRELAGAYTDPPTWIAGATLPASDLNTYVRDNFRALALQNSANRGSTLPGSPVDGQRYNYIADDTNGYEWALIYDASQTKWRWVGGTGLYAAVETSEATSSAAYTDLATAGPSVTVPLAGIYEIWFTCNVNPGGTPTFAAAVKLGAAATADAEAALGATAVMALTMRKRVTLAASDVLKLQYKTSGTTNFSNRRLSAVPVYVA